MQAELSTLTPAALVWLELVRQARALRRVAVPASDIGNRTGLDMATVAQSLDDLAADGLVTGWTDDKGQAVATLTPLAAERLGLQLRRNQDGYGILGWQPRSEKPWRERRKSRPGAITATDVGIDLDWHPDARTPSLKILRVSSEHALALGEKQGQRRLSDREMNPDRLPWPSIILMGVGAWSREQGQETCPTCEGRPLPANTTCGQCGRWGLDWLVARIHREEERASTARHTEEAERNQSKARTFAQRRASRAERARL
jgi:hypothetical protein